VQYVVSVLFDSLCYFLITRVMFHNILFMSVFFGLYVLSSILCILCFCIVLCFVPLLCIVIFFLILYKFTDLLPAVGNQIAVNKYRNVTSYRLLKVKLCAFVG